MRARTRYIGVGLDIWAKRHVRKLKISSMDGSAEAQPCARQRAWFNSATCMVGLRNLHGCTRASAWLGLQDCMVQLLRVNPLASNRPLTSPQ